MQLFQIENGMVKPTTEVLLTNPYKQVWDRDMSVGKEQAMKEFAYIEFMSSPKKTNPFWGYDTNKREAKVIENVFKGQPYHADDLVRQCLNQYIEFFNNASPHLSYLVSNRMVMEKVKQFYRDVNLNARNSRDMPLYKPAEITKAAADTFSVIKTLNSIQQIVDQEVYETVKTKGNKETNIFETGEL